MRPVSRAVSACKTIALSFFFVLMALGSLTAHADEITVTGEAAILDGNVESARDAALLDAFRKAVEKGVGTIIAADTLVQNYQVVQDKIFTKARGYVKRWEVLSEYPLGARYKMEVRCDVSKESISDDLIALNILQEAKHKPRIMVVMSEQHLWSYVDQPMSETTLVSRFLEKDFKVVDQAQSAEVRNSDKMKAAFKGDDKAAAYIGNRHDAEIIIVGKAFSETGGKIHDMETTRAGVEARAVRCDTAEVIAAGSAEAGGADISEAVAGKKAVRQAASELADDLIRQISERWSADIVGGSSVQLALSNVSFSSLSAFKKTLQTIEGVQDIHQRGFEGGTAILDVDYRYDTERMADSLIATDFGSSKIEIVGLTQNRIEIKMQ